MNGLKRIVDFLNYDMALKDDLLNKVGATFREPYEVAETKTIPSTDYSKLTFGNKGLVSELAFLFVDIRKSSKLHEEYGFANAAKIYQSFHDINVRVITAFDGEIRAFDGDRIMGVFSGDRKCTNAVKAAMKIRYGIDKILSPQLDKPLKIGLGVDFGKTLIVKVGRGRNVNNQDLIWVGEACNYASHYCQEAEQSIIISQRTYDRMNRSCKLDGDNKNMWKYKKITLKNNDVIKVIESTYRWSI
jgi:adenylate cyclase